MLVESRVVAGAVAGGGKLVIGWWQGGCEATGWPRAGSSRRGRVKGCLLGAAGPGAGWLAGCMGWGPPVAKARAAARLPALPPMQAAAAAGAEAAAGGGGRRIFLLGLHDRQRQHDYLRRQRRGARFPLRGERRVHGPLHLPCATHHAAAGGVVPGAGGEVMRPPEPRRERERESERRPAGWG